MEKELFFKAVEEKNIEYRKDSFSLAHYSFDASLYKVTPQAIIFPQNKEQLCATLLLAYQHKLAITPRGAATGIAGGCLGKGIIVDTARYLNRILSIDIENQLVTVEPGVIQDDLNFALKPYGFCLGPDTSTGNRATIGGMVANNAAGAHSLIYGAMVDHIEAIDLILASGKLITLSKKVSDQDILHVLQNITETYREEILARIPPLRRLSSGYLLQKLLKEEPNYAQIIAASEGTLGVISEVTLRISPLPPKKALLLLPFESMQEAADSIKNYLPLNPSAIEYLDHHILTSVPIHPAVQHAKALLIVEFFAPFPPLQGLFIEEEKQMQAIWEKRKSSLGILLSKRTYQRAVAFIEDISLPPLKISAFLQEFDQKLKALDVDYGIYGHFGEGCLHIRPYLNLLEDQELKLMEAIQQTTADLLLKYGGALSGEHGDGLVRSHLLKKMFGEKIMEAFELLKSAFDPENLMNPGKIVNPTPLTQDLRLNPAIKMQEMDTFLDFSKEGGMSFSLDMCNGNGQCRKKEGLMCPSFQVSHDEYDTTRARALSLRAIFSQELPLSSFAEEDVHAILELCLSCKGCKKECPSSVDMAKIKAEHLYQRGVKKGFSLKDHGIARIAYLLKKLSPFKRLINFFSPQKMAKKSFSSWIKEQEQDEAKERVALFIDTFTEHLHPETGKAAFNLLSHMGFFILPIQESCCGRPAFSRGLLHLAKKEAEVLLAKLTPYVEKNIPLIFLEPSCLSAIIDDYKALLPHQELMLTSCMPIASFLLQKKELLIKYQSKDKLLYHGHCHEKALYGTQDALTLLKLLFDAEEIPSGCCGMAGAFGLEKKHEKISLDIAELKLFPAIRNNPGALIVADGTSCRMQIQRGLKVHALHIAEAINLLLTADRSFE